MDEASSIAFSVGSTTLGQRTPEYVSLAAHPVAPVAAAVDGRHQHAYNYDGSGGPDGLRSEGHHSLSFIEFDDAGQSEEQQNGEEQLSVGGCDDAAAVFLRAVERFDTAKAAEESASASASILSPVVASRQAAASNCVVVQKGAAESPIRITAIPTALAAPTAAVETPAKEIVRTGPAFSAMVPLTPSARASVTANTSSTGESIQFMEEEDTQQDVPFESSSRDAHTAGPQRDDGATSTATPVVKMQRLVSPPSPGRVRGAVGPQRGPAGLPSNPCLMLPPEEDAVFCTVSDITVPLGTASYAGAVQSSGHVTPSSCRRGPASQRTTSIVASEMPRHAQIALPRALQKGSPLTAPTPVQGERPVVLAYPDGSPKSSPSPSQRRAERPVLPTSTSGGNGPPSANATVKTASTPSPPPVSTAAVAQPSGLPALILPSPQGPPKNSLNSTVRQQTEEESGCAAPPRRRSLSSIIASKIMCSHRSAAEVVEKSGILSRGTERETTEDATSYTSGRSRRSSHSHAKGLSRLFRRSSPPNALAATVASFRDEKEHSLSQPHEAAVPTKAAVAATAPLEHQIVSSNESGNMASPPPGLPEAAASVCSAVAPSLFSQDGSIPFQVEDDEEAALEGGTGDEILFHDEGFIKAEEELSCDDTPMGRGQQTPGRQRRNHRYSSKESGTENRSSSATSLRTSSATSITSEQLEKRRQRQRSKRRLRHAKQKQRQANRFQHLLEPSQSLRKKSTETTPCDNPLSVLLASPETASPNCKTSDVVKDKSRTTARTDAVAASGSSPSPATASLIDRRRVLLATSRVASSENHFEAAWRRAKHERFLKARQQSIDTARALSISTMQQQPVASTATKALVSFPEKSRRKTPPVTARQHAALPSPPLPSPMEGVVGQREEEILQEIEKLNALLAARQPHGTGASLVEAVAAAPRMVCRHQHRSNKSGQPPVLVRQPPRAAIVTNCLRKLRASSSSYSVSPSKRSPQKLEGSKSPMPRPPPVHRSSLPRVATRRYTESHELAPSSSLLFSDKNLLNSYEAVLANLLLLHQDSRNQPAATSNDLHGCSHPTEAGDIRQTRQQCQAALRAAYYYDGSRCATNSPSSSRALSSSSSSTAAAGVQRPRDGRARHGDPNNSIQNSGTATAEDAESMALHYISSVRPSCSACQPQEIDDYATLGIFSSVYSAAHRSTTDTTATTAGAASCTPRRTREAPVNPPATPLLRRKIREELYAPPPRSAGHFRSPEKRWDVASAVRWSGRSAAVPASTLPPQRQLEHRGMKAQRGTSRPAFAPSPEELQQLVLITICRAENAARRRIREREARQFAALRQSHDRWVMAQVQVLLAVEAAALTPPAESDNEAVASEGGARKAPDPVEVETTLEEDEEEGEEMAAALPSSSIYSEEGKNGTEEMEDETVAPVEEGCADATGAMSTSDGSGSSFQLDEEVISDGAIPSMPEGEEETKEAVAVPVSSLASVAFLGSDDGKQTATPIMPEEEDAQGKKGSTELTFDGDLPVPSSVDSRMSEKDSEELLQAGDPDSSARLQLEEDPSLLAGSTADVNEPCSTPEDCADLPDDNASVDAAVDALGQQLDAAQLTSSTFTTPTASTSTAALGAIMAMEVGEASIPRLNLNVDVAPLECNLRSDDNGNFGDEHVPCGEPDDIHEGCDEVRSTSASCIHEVEPVLVPCWTTSQLLATEESPATAAAPSSTSPPPPPSFVLTRRVHFSFPVDPSTDAAAPQPGHYVRESSSSRDSSVFVSPPSLQSFPAATFEPVTGAVLSPHRREDVGPSTEDDEDARAIVSPGEAATIEPRTAMALLERLDDLDQVLLHTLPQYFTEDSDEDGRALVVLRQATTGGSAPAVEDDQHQQVGIHGSREVEGNGLLLEPPRLPLVSLGARLRAKYRHLTPPQEFSGSKAAQTAPPLNVTVAASSPCSGGGQS